jgi:hypothetical protein
MVACRIGDPSNLIHQLQAFGEVAGSEDREGNRPQDSPVVDAGSIVELLGVISSAMAATVVSWADSSAHEWITSLPCTPCLVG